MSGSNIQGDVIDVSDTAKDVRLQTTMKSGNLTWQNVTDKPRWVHETSIYSTPVSLAEMHRKENYGEFGFKGIQDGHSIRQVYIQFKVPPMPTRMPPPPPPSRAPPPPPYQSPKRVNAPTYPAPGGSKWI